MYKTKHGLKREMTHEEVHEHRKKHGHKIENLEMELKMKKNLPFADYLPGGLGNPFNFTFAMKMARSVTRATRATLMPGKNKKNKLRDQYFEDLAKDGDWPDDTGEGAEGAEDAEDAEDGEENPGKEKKHKHHHHHHHKKKKEEEAGWFG